MSQLQIWDRLPEEEIVVKANELVTSNLDWTTREYRIFVAHVSEISKEDEDVKDLSVRLRDLCDMSEVSPENFYSEIEGLADRLTRKRIKVEEGPTGQREGGYFNVYSACEYDESTGEIVGSFTEEMKPLLLELKKQFTMYYRRRVLAMRSTYSMRFYEIVKRYEYQGHFKMSVEEIRNMFGLEDKYSRFGDLKRHVIDKAQSDLEEKTDVTFEYEVERDGRTPVAVRFDIEPVPGEVRGAPQLEGKETEGERPEATPERGPQEDRDPIATIYDGLPQSEREDIWERAEAEARRQNPDLEGRRLEAQTWRHINRIIKQEYL